MNPSAEQLREQYKDSDPFWMDWVTVTANNQEVEFFVGGIPREFDDLEGRTAFDNFLEDLDEETKVSVQYHLL